MKCGFWRDLLLEGDAFEYRRELKDGKPDWDLASVTGYAGGLFFANDLAYTPNLQPKVLESQSRDGTFRFRLPDYLASLSRSSDSMRMEFMTFDTRSNPAGLKSGIKFTWLASTSPHHSTD